MTSCVHLDATPVPPLPTNFKPPASIASPSAGTGFICGAASVVTTSVAVTPRRRGMPARTLVPVVILL